MRRFSNLFSYIFMSVLFAASGSSTRSSSGWLLSANKGDHTLGIIDPQADTQIAAVPEDGITGHEVAASPDGKFAYVPIYGNSGVGKPGTDGKNIVVVDLATRKISGNIEFSHGVRPHCPVFDRHSGMLYVTTELDQTITIIDPKTLKIVGTIPTGQPESHMLTVSHDGRRGYTANVGPGTVSVLDMQARKTLKIIPISKHTQRISISPDDSMVFTADQTKPQIVVIDTKTNSVKGDVPLDGLGYGTAPTMDGKYLLVAVQGPNQIAVIDLAQMKVVHTISVPAIPQALVVRPDNKVAYASCDTSHQVAAISIPDWSVKLIDAGKGTDGLAWANAQ
jgi:DNA-binding beta-propeller fold protein YncE